MFLFAKEQLVDPTNKFDFKHVCKINSATQHPVTSSGDVIRTHPVVFVYRVSFVVLVVLQLQPPSNQIWYKQCAANNVVVVVVIVVDDDDDVVVIVIAIGSVG